MSKNNQPDSNLTNFVFKKSFEVAYALCRIGQAISSKQFGKYFEKYALSFLDSAISRNIEELYTNILSTEYLLRLAESLGLVRQQLSETLIAELNKLKSYVDENKNELFIAEPNIYDIFNTKPESYPGLKKQKSRIDV